MNKYQKKREIVRQRGINFSNNIEKLTNKYGVDWVFDYQRKLEKEAKRVGLLKEFRENGVI